MFRVNKRVFFILQFGIGLSVTIGLVWWLGPESLYRAAENLSPVYTGIAAILSVAGLVVQAEKWRVLLVCLMPAATRREAISSLLTGMGLGLFTPGRLGELGRGIALPIQRKDVALLTLADRGISMGITLLFGALSFLFLKMYALLVITLFPLFVSGGIMIFFRKSERLRRMRLAKRGLAVLPRVSKRAWVISIMWALVFNCIFLTQFALLLGGSYGPSLEEILLGPAIFAVKSLVPVSFLDVGVREGVAVFFFSERGFNPLSAFNAALGMFVLNVAIPGCLGWLFVGRTALKTQLK